MEFRANIGAAVTPGIAEVAGLTLASFGFLGLRPGVLNPQP